MMDIETPLADAKGLASPRLAEQKGVLPLLPAELFELFDALLTFSFSEGL